MIDGPALGLFRRHVRHGTDDGPDGGPRTLIHHRAGHVRCRRARTHHLCQAEVEDLDLARVGNHHVAGFQIAVHDTGRVRGRQGIRDLDSVGEGLAEGQRLLPDRLVQRLSLDELHRDEVAVAGLRDLVDRDDAGMVQRRGRLRFLQEAAALVVGAGAVGRQELERRGAVQQHVAGLVDHAHAALAQLFEHLVVSDGRAVHPFTHGKACHRQPRRRRPAPSPWPTP